jgi:KAP family P-loop domain
MIENDLPIEKEEEDVFSRVDYVNSIIRHITTNWSKECKIIGLNGAWGAGKTSVLNLLDEKLNLQHHFFTQQYNPWRYSNEAVMIAELFRKIHEGAKSDESLGNSLKDLAENISKYQEIIILASTASLPLNPAVAFVLRIINSIAGFFSKRKSVSIEDIKDKINKILEKLVRPLIVFVDDVDRLDNNEIRQLFKILKLTADFNNLIYIVAFDDEVVSKILNESYTGNSELSGGKEFLDKIINIPMRIPHLNNHQRHTFLINRLLDFSRDFKISLFDDYEFNGRLKDCSYMLLKTPRDVKRVINSISFLRECLKNEVSFNDLIILEILRLYAPDVFRQILKFQEYLFNKSLDQTLKFPDFQGTTTESGEHFFTSVDIETYKKTEIINIVTYLFPFNTLFSSRPRPISEQFQTKLTLQNRVALKNNFDRYLKIGLLEKELSSDKLNSIIENINTLEIDASLKLIEDWDYSNFNQILEKLKLNEEAFTIEGKFKLYQIYCISDYFNQGNELDFMMGISPIHHVIKNFNALSKIDTFLTDTIQRITSIDRKIHLISLFKDAIEEDSQLQNHLDLINSIALDELKKILESDISVLFDNPEENKIHHIFKLVNQLNLRELFIFKVINYIKETGEILKVARSIKHKIYSFGSSKSRYDDEVTDDYFMMLEEVISREILIEEFNKLKHEYPLNYEITDDIKKINGIIIHKYLDYVERTKGID